MASAALLVSLSLLLTPLTLWAQTTPPNSAAGASFAVGNGLSPNIERNKKGDFVVAWIQRANQANGSSRTHMGAARPDLGSPVEASHQFNKSPASKSLFDELLSPGKLPSACNGVR